MTWLSRRVRALRSTRGFTIVEVLVGSMVLLTGLLALSQLFGSAASRVLSSDIRSVLHQTAAKEMESIRGLPYEDVGLKNSNPIGVLDEVSYVTVDVTRIKITRAVVFVTDPSYGGPYYANYKRLTLTVGAVDKSGVYMAGVQPVELVSYFAGGAEGGAILVKVQDSTGAPVEGAYFTITNSVLGVNYNAESQVTDSSGSMLVPGLTDDSGGNYVVTATKTGYSSDSETGFAVLEAGLQQVMLTIDRVSSLNVRVVNDTSGEDVPGLTVTMTGPQSYSSTITTATGGTLISDLRFSTSADPYILSLPDGQGFSAQHQSVALPAGTSQETVIHVTPIVATTLPPTTTTVLGTGSLRVTVRNSSGHKLNRQATVQLGDTTLSSPSNIVLFQYLNLTTYSLVVTATGYQTYSGSVTITGANSITIYLSKS